MRRKTVLHTFLGLLLFGSLAQSYGQRITLMEWTNEWRYLQSGAAAPANWFASNFVDTTWHLGRGVLGFPATENVLMVAPINTILNQTTNGAQIITYYFRTSLTLTSNPTALAIMASNVIDDGAVFYVNGREVQRVAMPTTAISYTTEATRQDDISAHGADIFTIPSSNFVQGVNRIAVELHQGGIPSSDGIFGMKLFADILQPPVITVHPQDQEVDVPQSVTFTVAATGSAPLTYRWYTNGVLVAGQGGTSYRIPSTTLAMNGRVIHAEVSNVVGVARSSNAVLTARLDQTGPILVSAISTSPMRIEATFNEALRPAVSNGPPVATTNLASYVVHQLGTTNRVPITSLVYGVNRMLLNLGSPLDIATDHVPTEYILCVYNLQDTKTNTTPQDCIGVSFIVTTNIFSVGSEWHFHTLIIDNTLANTNWTDPQFDDSESAGWGIANAYFYNEANPTPNSCTSPFTEVLKGLRTHYFRKKFTLFSGTGWPSAVTATFRHSVDDGAVFYINGIEIARYNMAPGPVDYFTVATGDGTDPTGCLTLSGAVPLSVLNFGANGTNNVFAVEVHQQEVNPGGTAGDVYFDTDLSLTYRHTPTIPTLNVARTYTTNFQGRVVATNSVVTWVGSGWQLQHATAPTGTWQNVSAPVVMGTNRYSTIVPQQGPRRFYRLKNP